MPTLKLTRTQRRRLRKLHDSIERITQCDLAYFESFPNRRYRIREADRAEIEHGELTGTGVTLRPGSQHYRAIRYLTPYACLSVPVGGPAGADPDSVDEDMAQAIFEYADKPLIDMPCDHTHTELLVVIKALK